MLRANYLANTITVRAAHSLTGGDYQYLQRSVIPTYHFQKSLRRLPIPKLSDSVNRFLASAKPVLSEEVFQNTEKSIKRFENGAGQDLHAALLDYDKNHKDTSYISEPWFDMYLSSRVPIPVNFNPFMMYAPEPESKFNNQLTRAVNFAISYARFKKSLDSNILAPEVFHMNPEKSDTNIFRTVCRTLPPSLSWFGAVAFKAFPLDMSQYKSLFNGTRIPKKGKDVLFHEHSARHFMVMNKGRIYSVDIFDNQGNILPAEDIHASLNHILSTATELDSSSCIGSLTTLNRDSWAGLREQLETEGNSESLRAIDGALFTLCLDDMKTDNHKKLVESLLIGNEAKNRWFDKCFQLIVDGNGQATVNFEHSWGDGVAVLRLMEESLRDTKKHHFVTPDDFPKSVNEQQVRELRFNLSDSIKANIQAAQTEHIKANSTLDFATMEYEKMTRESIKKTKLSPDSVMQLAIQMAYHSVYGEFAPTYESCSTAAFLKGRTECMRSATSATREATLAIASGKTDVMPLLQKCSADHGQLVKEASMGDATTWPSVGHVVASPTNVSLTAIAYFLGLLETPQQGWANVDKGQGFDRHLLGLKITAGRLGQKIPEFFEDAGYNRMGHFVLSTSTLSTETIIFGGFGPVVQDGLGIGYNVSSQKLGAVISSHKDKRDASEFASALQKSLDVLKSLTERST